MPIYPKMPTLNPDASTGKAYSKPISPAPVTHKMIPLPDIHAPRSQTKFVPPALSAQDHSKLISPASTEGHPFPSATEMSAKLDALIAGKEKEINQLEKEATKGPTPENMITLQQSVHDLSSLQDNKMVLAKGQDEHKALERAVLNALFNSIKN